MYDIPNAKMFMDSVHGYISIPKTFVQNIIDTNYFQRLHNVNQTGMGILYPNGKHDRYSHSLGVYHLGLKAVDSLLANFSKNMYWKISSDNTCDVFWSKNKVLFLIACLLHDIGHTPYSHSLEDVIFENSIKLKQRLAEILTNIGGQAISPMNIKAASHEIIGSLLIFDKLKENIVNILNELGDSDYPNSVNYYISEYAKKPQTINASDIDNDMGFIIRMIIGLKYDDYKPEHQIQNCFIELLNGKNFDVDKLDYIIRDTKMSGISNISIDVERLLNSLTLVPLTQYSDYDFLNYSLNNSYVQNVKFSKNSECNFSGYFDGVIQLPADTTVRIHKNSQNISLEPCKNQSFRLQKNARIIVLDFAKLSSAESVYVDNKEKLFDSEEQAFTIEKSSEPTHVIIHNATLNANRESGLYFKVEQYSYDMKIKGFCEFTIKGDAEIVLAKCNATLNGKYRFLKAIGDHLTEHGQIPAENAYNTFSVGFKKQSINLLSNILEARDYLYLWIYAHHKVIYYANFLIPYLSQLIEKYAFDDKFPPWKLKYDHIELLDDDYFNTTLKYVYIMSSNELTDIEKQLLQELFSRKYMKSVYKSLAEYDLFFSGFSEHQKNSIKKHLIDMCKEEESDSRDDVKFGILPKSKVDEINLIDKDVIFETIVWVDASYTHKELDKLETYCVFPTQTVTMEYLDLFKSQKHFTTSNTNQYFYLYYKSSTNDSLKIHHALQKYFESLSFDYLIS